MSAPRPEGMPDNYHDYVFKDGRLVGDFDNMYRYAREVPWGQDERHRFWTAETAMLMMRDRGPFASILEIGCGLGYFTDKLRSAARPGAEIHGFDVSQEAVLRASELHPGLSFYTGDIADPDFKPRRLFDLVVVRDLFWYVTDALEAVLSNIERCLAPGGHLHVAQSFPNLDRPFVGKDVLPDPDALAARFSRYTTIYSARLRNHMLESDGPILHLLARKP